MKLLYCEYCGDIIAPHRKANQVRFCNCGRHAVWWVNPVTGILKVHDRYGDNGTAWVIGINNAFLGWPAKHDAESVHTLLADIPDSYIFKKIGSHIIRIRPGESSDTSWARELPDG